MPNMKVTMTEADIRQAVEDWAAERHGMKAKNIRVGARLKWVGNGVNEEQRPVLEITFET